MKQLCGIVLFVTCFLILHYKICLKMENKVEIDIIILSYARNPELQQISIDCIDSLLASEDAEEIIFNVVVIESEKSLKGYQYPSSTTVYPEEPFGFHRYMNIGIDMTTAKYVCLCNNDLIFYNRWASEILKYMDEIPDLISASPICSYLNRYTGIPLNSGIKLGYRVGFEISGWCLFMKREIFKKIGRLDENYSFTAADHDYANTLGVLHLKHALITSSIVDHLNTMTLNTYNEEKQVELMTVSTYHKMKWGHRILPEEAKNC